MTKTIVRKRSDRVITPGVSMMVLQSIPIIFLAIFIWKSKSEFLFDVSTGEFRLQGNDEYIDKLLQNFNWSEVLFKKKNNKMNLEKLWRRLSYFYLEDWIFKDDYAVETLTKHFKPVSERIWNRRLQDRIIASEPFCIIWSETQHNKSTSINGLRRCLRLMDRFTIRNLELYHSYNPNAVTLLDVIDKTLSHGWKITETMVGIVFKRCK
jgi:DNA mismatch repair protein MutS